MQYICVSLFDLIVGNVRGHDIVTIFYNLLYVFMYRYFWLARTLLSYTHSIHEREHVRLFLSIVCMQLRYCCEEIEKKFGPEILNLQVWF